MSRIDGSSGATGGTVQNDVEATLPDAAKKPPAASPPPAGNLVEAYDSRYGQPEQHSFPGAEVDRSLSQFPAAALQLPGVPMKRVDVGGEPVRQAGADSKPAPAARRGPDELLVKAASELIVDAKKGDAVLRELNQLPKADLEAVLSKLDRSGELEGALKKLSPEQRQAFFARLKDLGLVQVVSSKPPSSAALNPPATPELVQVSGSMPAALREVAMEQNRAAVSGFRHEEAAYHQRYTAAVASAKSGEELRALGPYEPPKSISFPGDVRYFNANPDQVRKWSSLGNSPSERRLLDALDKRVCELTGRSRPGYSVDAEVEVKGESGSLRRGGSIDSDGHRKEELEVSVQQKNGAYASIDGEGNVSGGHHQKVGGADLTEKVGPDGEHSYSLEGERGEHSVDATVAFNRNGDLSNVGFHVDGTGAETDGNKTTLSIGHGGFTASTSVDLKERTLGAGVEYEGEVGKNKLKVKLGFSARGITPEEAKDVALSIGLFATPTPLQAGVPWEKLSAEDRAAFTRLGWTSDEWARKLPKK